MANGTTMRQPRVDATRDEWLVYADALQEADDPRGMFLALYAAGPSQSEALAAYTREHAAALLGDDAAEHVEAYDLLWTWLYVTFAEVRVAQTEDGPELVRALLASPAASALGELALVGAPEDEQTRVDLAPAVAELAARLPASCHSVALDDARAVAATRLVSRDFEPEDNLVAFGPLDAIARRVEALSVTTADVHQLTLGAIDAPALREFALLPLRWGTTYGGGPSDVARALAEARWPSLRSLELRLVETWLQNMPDDSDAYRPVYSGADFADRYGDVGDDDEDDRGDAETDWRVELRGVLENVRAVPLARLALTSFRSTRPLLDALAEVGLPATLEELDLSDSALSTADVAAMLERRATFAGLARLVVRGTRLTADDVARLAGVGPEVVHEPGAGPTYRYVVGME